MNKFGGLMVLGCLVFSSIDALIHVSLNGHEFVSREKESNSNKKIYEI